MWHAASHLHLMRSCLDNTSFFDKLQISAMVLMACSLCLPSAPSNSWNSLAKSKVNFMRARVCPAFAFSCKVFLLSTCLGQSASRAACSWSSLLCSTWPAFLSGRCSLSEAHCRLFASTPVLSAPTTTTKLQRTHSKACQDPLPCC